ncbi:DUF5958 family protein [Streptomyces cellulosae]|uniref:DUF5958 family protein n=1 Tax=Streptomyces sp. UNC401CLCol TaxID=1449077 RepID=UPI000AB00D25
MASAHEVMLNELAQGLRPMADGVEWFEGLAEDEQRRVLRLLIYFCGEARARVEDGPETGARSCIRPPRTHRW